MRSRVIILTLAAAAFIAFVALRPTTTSKLDEADYFVPLVGGVGIHHRCDGPEDPEAGTYIECEQRPSPLILSRGDVREVAVVGSIIVGTAGSSYFFFDTAELATSRPNDGAEVFTAREPWIDAMRGVGISEVPKFATAAQLAKGVQDQILHAQDYRRLHGKFGWNDHVWSDNILVGCILFIFFLGVALPSPYPNVRLIMSIILGVVVSMYCEVGIGGDTGPLGLAYIPILWGIGWIGSFCGRRFLPRS